MAYLAGDEQLNNARGEKRADLKASVTLSSHFMPGN